MPSTTALPSATPATPPSAPPPPSSAGSAAAPADPSVGGAVEADVGVGVPELLVGEPVVLAVAPAEPRPADVDPGDAFAVLVERDFPVPAVLLAEPVGFGLAGFVLLGLGDGLVASCGQMTFAAVLGGGVLPPSCHTQPSVDPGFGLWLPAPSLA
jgi:hypothetical protein